MQTRLAMARTFLISVAAWMLGSAYLTPAIGVDLDKVTDACRQMYGCDLYVDPSGRILGETPTIVFRCEPATVPPLCHIATALKSARALTSEERRLMEALGLPRLAAQ